MHILCLHVWCVCMKYMCNYSYNYLCSLSSFCKMHVFYLCAHICGKNPLFQIIQENIILVYKSLYIQRKNRIGTPSGF